MSQHYAITLRTSWPDVTTLNLNVTTLPGRTLAVGSANVETLWPMLPHQTKGYDSLERCHNLKSRCRYIGQGCSPQLWAMSRHRCNSGKSISRHWTTSA